MTSMGLRTTLKNEKEGTILDEQILTSNFKLHIKY